MANNTSTMLNWQSLPSWANVWRGLAVVNGIGSHALVWNGWFMKDVSDSPSDRSAKSLQLYWVYWSFLSFSQN